MQGMVLDHVGVAVNDLDVAAAAFRDRLGLAEVGREVLAHLGIRVAYFGADGESLVQLLAPLGPGNLRDHLERRGEGLHHLCYAVADIEAAAAVLAPGSDVAIVRGGRGRRACFLPGAAAGVLIELTEAEPSFAVGE